MEFRFLFPPEIYLYIRCKSVSFQISLFTSCSKNNLKWSTRHDSASYGYSSSFRSSFKTPRHLFRGVFPKFFFSTVHVLFFFFFFFISLNCFLLVTGTIIIFPEEAKSYRELTRELEEAELEEDRM